MNSLSLSKDSQFLRSHCAMYLLDLPFDVLSIILEDISQHDATQLAVTSHRAHEIVYPSHQ